MRITVGRAVAAAAAGCGLVAVALVARSSPTHAFEQHFRSGQPSRGRILGPPTGSPSVISTPAAPLSNRQQNGDWTKTVILLLAVAICVSVIILVLRSWPGRGRRSKEPVEAFKGVQEEPVVDRPPAAVTDAIGAGLDVLERGAVSDAIIACWLQVETAAAAAGAPIRATETAAEFVDRVLGAYGVPEPPLRRLAALYREARFSLHPLGEDARAEARGLLAAIRNDLGYSHARP